MSFASFNASVSIVSSCTTRAHDLGFRTSVKRPKQTRGRRCAWCCISKRSARLSALCRLAKTWGNRVQGFGRRVWDLSKAAETKARKVLGVDFRLVQRICQHCVVLHNKGSGFGLQDVSKAAETNAKDERCFVLSFASFNASVRIVSSCRTMNAFRAQG